MSSYFRSISVFSLLYVFFIPPPVLTIHVLDDPGWSQDLFSLFALRTRLLVFLSVINKNVFEMLVIFILKITFFSGFYLCCVPTEKSRYR